MILFFSGTGNSEYAAKRIGKTINDDAVNLFEKIRSRDFSQLHSNRPWVIVSPPMPGGYRASCRNGWRTQSLRETEASIL